MSKQATYSIGFRVFRRLIRPLHRRGLALYKIIAKSCHHLLRLFGIKPKKIVMLPIQQHKMYVDIFDMSIPPSLIVLGVWEPGTTTLIKKLIQTNMTVVDIGANIGYYTLIAAYLVGPHGKVYAFEPEPNNFNLLNKNVQVNKYNNVVTVCKAVADRVSISKMILHPTGHGAHKLLTTNNAHETTVSVEVTTLDKFFKDIKKPIDVVKIDVEGFEPAVVDGMRNIIKQNPNIKLLLEFHPRIIQQCGYSPKDFLTDIEHYGFKMFYIDEASGQLAAIKNIDALLLDIHDTTAFNILCSRSIINL